MLFDQRGEAVSFAVAIPGTAADEPRRSGEAGRRAPRTGRLKRRRGARWRMIFAHPATQQTKRNRARASMASYSTNEFRSGLKILIDNDPCVIVENEFVKPGKGQAFNRVRIRNLKTGRVVDKTFKSGDTVEAADVVDQDMQYLYTDGEFWHF